MSKYSSLLQVISTIFVISISFILTGIVDEIWEHGDTTTVKFYKQQESDTW